MKLTLRELRNLVGKELKMLDEAFGDLPRMQSHDEYKSARREELLKSSRPRWDVPDDYEAPPDLSPEGAAMRAFAELSGMRTYASNLEPVEKDDGSWVVFYRIRSN